MTDAINFFQTLKIFGLFSKPNFNTSARKLSRELIKDARRALERAEAEARNAAEAEKLLLSSRDENLKNNLAKIAAWHHEAAAKHFRQTAARYSEASRIRTDQKKALVYHSEKNIRLAREAEKAFASLSDYNG